MASLSASPAPRQVSTGDLRRSPGNTRGIRPTTGQYTGDEPGHLPQGLDTTLVTAMGPGPVEGPLVDVLGSVSPGSPTLLVLLVLGTYTTGYVSVKQQATS